MAALTPILLYTRIWQAGKMRLVETIPGESGPYCVFVTIAGDSFSVTKPPISKETEAALVEQLRAILDDEGELVHK